MNNAIRVILTGNFTSDGSKALHVKVNVQHYLTLKRLFKNKQETFLNNQ